ncbi:hypothetical protein LTR53_001314 [Teratosphaeriaceae sp. CCFEE 6253]|nr:hypothetical protein LTR53_001314 [Teratosphaeriaceae sp. CCFEE 6253]
MPLPIAQPETLNHHDPPAHDAQRPAKRVRFDSDALLQKDVGTKNDTTLVRKHPLGVRPLGNALTSAVNLKHACGRFALLPDELLAQLLELLHAKDLLLLGGTCRALHAFTRNDELWKALFIASPPSDFTWRSTWRSTLLSQDPSREPRVDCANLFSDVLHRPFFCTHVPLSHYAENIPRSDAIARFADLSPEAFEADWVDQPFILTAPVKRWPVYRSWSTEQLLERHAETRFVAEAVEWPLRSYVEYMSNNADESPLYLFDRSFVEKMGLTVSAAPDAHDDESGEAGAGTGAGPDYWPPPCFGRDLFAVLGAQRPDHRWLIVGPARSGSTFHQDPNGTSAWNAVLRGRKYWILFPPSSSSSSNATPLPPGVYVSEDRSEVTSPLSIAEWLLCFHAQARATPGCVEAVCEEGEVLHVPSGWYHLVLNLEAGAAVTQNFVPRGRVGGVLRFLRDQRRSVSGFGEGVGDAFGLFVERLGEGDAVVLGEGLAELERIGKGGRGRWAELTKATKGDDEEDAGAGGFSFDFGDGDEDAEVP